MMISKLTALVLMVAAASSLLGSDGTALGMVLLAAISGVVDLRNRQAAVPIWVES